MTTTQTPSDPYFPGTLVEDFTKKKKKTNVPLVEYNENAAREAVSSFEALDLKDPVREALGKLGWKEPTPVQQLCLPFTLKGRDVAGFAQTGTGKTGVFLLTIAERLLAHEGELESGRAPRAVVLAPTRELALQIDQDAQTVLSTCGLESLAVFGGIDYDKQARRLRDGIDVIVATPGRLKDYVQKNVVSLDKLEVFVCDEADRMFDMGFIEDVHFFLERLPETAQKLLFSATTNDEVKELAFEYLESPEYISVNPEVLTPEKIEQKAIHVNAGDKLKVLLGLIRDHQPECAIIFTNTKLTAEWLHYKLVHNGIEADLITGDLPQKKRIRLIQKIKEGRIKALVATDVASRGLHISRVSHVYNFDLPDEPANYVHRIGRTARAGARGVAYSLICDDYGHNMAPILELLGDSVSINSEWFDERYLQIEDKAGNPFEDPEAGPSIQKAMAPRESRGTREGRRGASRKEKGKGGEREEKKASHRQEASEERGRDGRRGHGRPGAGKGGQDKRRPQGAAIAAEAQGQQGGKKRRRRRRRGRGQEAHRHHQPGAQQHAKEAAPAEANSVTGLIKKVFRSLFGKK